MAEDTKPGAKAADPKPAADLPAPAPPPTPRTAAPEFSPEVLAAAARIAAEMVATRHAPATRIPGSDRAPKGGKYLVEGRFVNAWGEPYVEGGDGTADNPELPRMR